MNLIPSELIRNGIDVYLNQFSASCQKVYLLVICFVITAFVSLPFIYVDISVQEAGIIRPVTEKTEIRSSVTERVDSVYVREGQMLIKGDTILTFHSANPDFQIEYRQKRLSDLKEHINDLTILTKGQRPDFFHSASRRAEYAQFIQHKREQETILSKVEKDFERHLMLFEKGIVSAEEYENYRYEFEKNRNMLVSLENSRISQWQNELNTYINAFEEMTTALYQQLKERDRYAVTSPVTGYLDQFNGIYGGSIVQAGSLLAVISPDSTLYAEIYVSPRNIGYIGKNMPVTIQIGSFNYNEWGNISGMVTEVSSDFLIDNNGNKAFYKVKCSMDKNYLLRKNGVSGSVKKGMTAIAHFRITKRSLLGSMYQRIDDRVNPAQYLNRETD